MNFTLFRIPVIVEPSFWVFLLLIALQSGYPTAQMLVVLAVFSFSILFHEYGHGLTARYFGKDPEIHLIAFGGYAAYNSVGLSERKQFIITLNGPVFTALLMALSYYILKIDIFHSYLIRLFLYQAFHLNLFLLCVNLVPLYPLDGGQLLRYLLTKKLGDENGLRISLIIGNVAAVLGAAYFFYTGSYFFAFFFLFHGFQNLQASNRPTLQVPSNFSQYNEALKAAENNETERAKAILKNLIKVNDDYIKTLSLESLAAILDQEGQSKQAYHLLLSADHERLKKGKCLLCKLAFEEKNYTLVEVYSREIYGLNPAYETALLISRAYAGLNKPEESGGWIKTASMFEGNSVEEAVKGKIYDSVRNDRIFQQSAQK